MLGDTDYRTKGFGHDNYGFPCLLCPLPSDYIRPDMKKRSNVYGKELLTLNVFFVL